MAKEFTAGNVKEHLGCAYNTAVSALSGLVELQVFEKKKMGREWVYFLRVSAGGGLNNGSETAHSRAVSA